MYELWREKQQEGGVHLVPVHVLRLALEEIGDGDRVDIDHPHPGHRRNHGGECFLMRVVLVGGEQDELAEPCRLPRRQQVVEHAVQGLPANRGVTGERAFGHDVDPIFHRRCAQHTILRRQIIGETLGDDRSSADREVRAMLLARPHRHDEARILGENRRDLSGSHLFEPARRRRGGGEGDGHFHW